MTAPDLIARLEALSAPSRLLDAEVHRAVSPHLHDAIPDATGWVVGGNHEMPTAAPKYTSSLDAALTLVPEQHAPAITPTFLSEGHGYWVQISRLARYAVSPLTHATARHLALPIALCIAAMRARASSEGMSK